MKLIKIEKVSDSTNCYVIEAGCSPFSKEFNIWIDKAKKEVWGDAVRYGVWDDLTLEECKEILNKLKIKF